MFTLYVWACSWVVQPQKVQHCAWSVSLCSPLRLTACRELMLWMSRWLLQHPWDPPKLAQPFPVSHLWIFWTPWSSCLNSGAVLKPGAALGHPGHTAVAYVSHQILHKKWTGMHLWECGQLLTTTTPSNPLV